MSGKGLRLQARGCLVVLLVVIAGFGVGALARCGHTPWRDSRDRELADVAREDAPSARDESSDSGGTAGEAGNGGASQDDAVPTQEEPSAGVSASTMEGSVEQVATSLLTSYRDAGDCVLANAGYLDLLGLVWGCVVCGDGWVDVCVVFEGQDPSSCAVRVLRLETDEVEALFAEGDELT